MSKLPDISPDSTATDPGLAAMLQAREDRWRHRLYLSQQHQSNILSITLCLPLRYRSSPACKALFYRLCQEIMGCLEEAGFSPLALPPCDGADGPAFFAAVAGSPQEIKRHCIYLEDSLKLGRMLDIDLSDSSGNPLGRSDLGLPPRRCFVCSAPAAVCVSRKLHSPAEIDEAVQALLHQAGIDTVN